MTPAETARLLAAVIAYDNRTLNEAVVAAWHEVLSGYTFEDCLRAVKDHYASETTFLMPAAVRARVKAMRADRISRAREPIPPGHLSDREQIEWLRQARHAIGNGASPDELEAIEERKPRALLPALAGVFRSA